jgi:hypothetical protein
MIDITTIQTFKIPPSIVELQEANLHLTEANQKLLDKNDTLKKILIVLLISIGIVALVEFLKKRKTDKNENSNNKLRRK